MTLKWRVQYCTRNVAYSVHDGRVEESESAGVEKQKVLRARCGGADRLAAAAASQQAPAASTAGLTEPVAEVLERLCFLRAREKGRSGEAGCSSHGREGGVRGREGVRPQSPFEKPRDEMREQS